MRVFDCFPLFNEVDLLELRLNELWDVVDFFVIVEARKTFTDNPKTLCLTENNDRFAKYMDKIRYVVLDVFPEGLGNWGREEYQRNYIIEGLSDIAPDDILILSDLDEIPRAEAVANVVAGGIRPSEVYCFSLECYSFYLNLRVNKRWERQGPRMIRAGDLNDFQSLRRVLAPAKGLGRNVMRQIKSSRQMKRWVRRIMVHDGGWHLTWMGGNAAVALKGSSIAEHSHMPKGEKTVDWADTRMKSVLDDNSLYELVDAEKHMPDFVRKRPDLFEKYILR
ncbi:MAG: hypothetical protein AB8B51_00830 [Sedimentitalea sp.]